MIVGVLTHEERHAHMAEAIKLFPMLKKRPLTSSRRISIVCYGPSLNDTWEDIKGPVMTVSGAHDFLMARGITPEWHVDCDPLEHKAGMLTPNDSTRYLMASVCHPKVWPKLKGKKVSLWHLINGDYYETPSWVMKHHPQGLDCMFGGGSTVGMRAMEIAAALGFRRFDIHGMDCSFGESRHAGPHSGKRQLETLVRCNGRQFKTSPQMLQAAQEMERFLLTMDADITFHGDGLVQEMSRAIQLKKAA